MSKDPIGFVFLDVSHPVIAWMVYRGVLQSIDQASTPNLISPFMGKILTRGSDAMLVDREGRFEGARQLHGPQKLSRLSSVYAYPDLASAQHGVSVVGFKRENMSPVLPVGEYRSEVFDAGLIDDYGAYPDDNLAFRYWTQPATGPHREMLLKGKFEILDDEIRMRAKKNVWDLGVGSRLALEVSRLAALFGLEIGAVYPRLQKEPTGGFSLRYMIRWDDQICSKVVSEAYRRFCEDQTFYVDWEALEPIQVKPAKRDPKFFKLPDLGNSFVKTISSETMAALQQASFSYVAANK